MNETAEPWVPLPPPDQPASFPVDALCVNCNHPHSSHAPGGCLSRAIGTGYQCACPGFLHVEDAS